jgi:hypothetical protein
VIIENAMPDSSAYYLRRKFRFLWEFDLVARSAHSVLEKYFGADAKSLTSDARREFENLLPQLPYIGGKQPFTEFIVFTAMFLALYRVNKAQGRSAAQTGELMYEIGRVFLDSYPVFLRFMFGRMNFSRRYLKHLRKGAVELHQRKYAEGYVINFIEGDGMNSEALGWGLTRTMTLAEGAEKCDFRFKMGGKTSVVVPVAMRDVVSRRNEP